MHLPSSHSPEEGQSALSWIGAAIALSAFIAFLIQVPLITNGKVLLAELPWLPSMGVHFSFRLDGLSLLFSLLISGMGTLIFLYSGTSLRGHPYFIRFHVFLIMFMGSMLGLVLSDNIILLFVFWELTTISSYFLIGFDHDQEKARKAALQGLLVTAGGGLALLAGFLLVIEITHATELTALLKSTQGIRDHSLYLPCLILIAIGAFTKSAQFPFHFWLPNAMQAPTPVSAYLHSATMVKAGIYLLARFSPLLAGTEAWGALIVTAGVATMITGAVLSLLQYDLKLLLAYMTITALGLFTALLGIGSDIAIQAALVYLLVHSLYKGALFLIAGILDHQVGTRDIRVLRTLSGLSSRLRWTFIASTLAGLAMAGLPPFFGFIGKELILETVWATSSEPSWTWLALLAVTVFTMAAVVASAISSAFVPFSARRSNIKHDISEASIALWFPPLLLGFLGLIFGLFPGLLINPLIHAASTTVLPHPVEAQLALWHGLTPALATSVVSLLFGFALFSLRRRYAAFWNQRLSFPGPEMGYEKLFKGLNQFALLQTRFFQSGSLRVYQWFTLGFSILALTCSLQLSQVPAFPDHWKEMRFYEGLLSSLIILGAAGAVLAKFPLIAIIALGATGYGVALLYVLFGAPDLAMTQFLVETLTVILFASTLIHLPGFVAFEKRRLPQMVNVLLSAGMGLLVVPILWSTVQGELNLSLSDYFARQSMPAAHGRNIVNVILVDFRALDTWGEIMVIALAGLGVLNLIRLKPSARRSS